MRLTASLVLGLSLLASCSDDDDGMGGFGVGGGTTVASSSNVTTGGPITSTTVTSTTAASTANSTVSTGSGEGGTGGGPDYPVGPYGIDEGETIADYEFLGIVDPNASDDIVPMRLADLYNPTGNGVFEMGSPFPEGTPKPKALLLGICSVWAGPCGYEADILPAQYGTYHPPGGEFLFLLEDGVNPGTPPTEANLTSWVVNHPANFPNAIDPGQTIAPLLMAYPTNLVIDLQSMTITTVEYGAPAGDSPIWEGLDQLLGL